MEGREFEHELRDLVAERIVELVDEATHVLTMHGEAEYERWRGERLTNAQVSEVSFNHRPHVCPKPGRA